MEENKVTLASASELQRNRLYFATFRTNSKPKNTVNTHYFTIDNEMVYENFFNDFGPLTICMLYRYCTKLNRKLKSKLHARKKIIHYTSTNEENRLNAAFLIGAHSILYSKRSPAAAHKLLTCGNIPPFILYRDASYGGSAHKLGLLDCLNAVYKANRSGFFNFDDFDAVEYEYYELVEYGDFNWIVPEKFLAFSGPHDESRLKNGYLYHAPETYFNYFRQHNVSTIVRLNVRMYEASRFTDAGFAHFDLYFVDGSTPSDAILARFLAICEQTPDAVAVHCKAGLGRTGSLICAYIIKHYAFSAMEAIAWVRLCRPGSVIGHQQQWLLDKETWLLLEGVRHRKAAGILETDQRPFGIYSVRQRTLRERAACRKAAAAAAAVAAVAAQNAAAAAATPSAAPAASPAKRSALRDRVHKISERVDTMHLYDDDSNDSSDDSDRPMPVLTPYYNVTRVVHGPLPRSPPTLQPTLVQTLPSYARMTIAKTAAAATPKTTATPTQGDTLNQIKAMRRRHSRDDAVSQRHGRAKSQPFRNPACPGNRHPISTAAAASPMKAVTIVETTRSAGTTPTTAPTTAASRVNRVTLYKKRFTMVAGMHPSVATTPAMRQQQPARDSALSDNQLNNNVHHHIAGQTGQLSSPTTVVRFTVAAATASANNKKDDGTTKQRFAVRRSARSPVRYLNTGGTFRKGAVATVTSTPTTPTPFLGHLDRLNGNEVSNTAGSTADPTPLNGNTGAPAAAEVLLELSPGHTRDATAAVAAAAAAAASGLTAFPTPAPASSLKRGKRSLSSNRSDRSDKRASTASTVAAVSAAVSAVAGSKPSTGTSAGGSSMGAASTSMSMRLRKR